MNDCFVFADVNWAAKAYNKVAKWPKLFYVIWLFMDYYILEREVYGIQGSGKKKKKKWQKGHEECL